MGKVVLAIDTSASIDQVALSQFETEMQSILAEMQPEQTDVIYCDTKVQRTETFTAGETVALSAIGGGGTRFQPVFDAVEEPPACLVYFTDLEAAMPIEPGYPVLWAVCGSRIAEFGETITLE
jgi:predicted metal-dependent peptidase